MADQTLDQLADSASAEDTDNIYATRNGNSIRMRLAVALASRVSQARLISTINGIKGGGPLSADRTLELDVDGLIEDLAPDLSNDFVVSHDVSSGNPRKVRMSRLVSIGGGSETSPGFSSISASGQTTISATTPGETLNFASGSNIQIQTDSAAKTVRWIVSGLASNLIAIGTGAGLTGGGNLTANRSISVDIPSLSEDTAPDASADFAMVHDTSSGLLRKVRLSLLSSSSYSLPSASQSRLGGIRIGSGFTYDEQSGILSVAPTGTSYVLPPATDTTRGGIRIGAGFTLNGDILINANPTPFVLPAAGVNTLGGVKQGPGVDISADGTLSVTGGGGGGSDNSFRPENYGAIRGSGLTQLQREGNTAAINACWAQASVVKGKVDMGGGTWEIYGALTISNVSTMRIEGDWCVIRQFQTAMSVISITNATQITMSGLGLTYQSNQTAGADPLLNETYVAALRLNAVSNCRFSDIDTFNAWVHLGLSGGAGSFSNTFTNIRLNMATGQSYGLVHKTGNANNFINLRVTGGLTTQTVSGGVHITSADQVTFTNLVAESLSALRPLHFSAVRAATVTGGVVNRISPRATSGYGTVISGASGSMIQMTGLHVSGTQLSTASQAMGEAALFAGEDGCSFLIANMTLSGTVKDGSTRLSLLGHTSAAVAKNVTGTFQQIRLDTNPSSPHLLDELSVAAVDTTSDILIGPVLSYNSVLGDVTGGLYSMGDESLTVYPQVHGRHIQCAVALLSERTVTLARTIDRPYASGSYSAPRTVRGATFRVTRSPLSTGSALLTVANHNGSSIVALATNQSVLVIFDGANFVMVPGSLSTGGGGGGASVVYATTAEALTGTSTTTVMNPARTKEAFNALATANELTGLPGQVLSFDASGNAATVKLTRTITVPLVGEFDQITTKAPARRFMMPFSMKLTEIRVFVVSTGTSATTIDVNAAGTSILTTPVTVSSNSQFSSTASFTSASTGTIAVNTIVDFDIDQAGAGAKGVQVTLVGNEI